MEFDDLAKKYDAWYTTPFGAYADKLEKELIFKFLGDVKGKKILDLGCGTGNYSIELAKFRADIIGLDSSIEMLKVAKEKAKNITFVLGSMEHLPFKIRSFDSVVSVTALEFCLGSSKEAVKEARRVTRNNGRMVVGVLNKWSLFYVLKKISFSESIYKKARFYSILDLRNLFGRVDWASSIFALPFMPGWFLGALARFEKPLSKLCKPFGAFIVIKVDLKC